MSATLAKENIRVNCILPGAIRTSLLSDEIWSQFAKENLTPIEEVVSAVMGLVYDAKAVGKALEISSGEVFDRRQPAFSNDTMAKIMTSVSY